MVGEDLRAARLRLGMTQAELAAWLGVPARQHIGRWERGERDVPAYIAAHVRTLLKWRRGASWPGAPTSSEGDGPTN